MQMRAIRNKQDYVFEENVVRCEEAEAVTFSQHNASAGDQWSWLLRMNLRILVKNESFL